MDKTTGSAPKKDRQTVNANWETLGARIQGVTVKPLTTLPDERGTLCELFRPSWGFHPEPLAFVYQFTVRPGRIKGWQKHERQDDRIFVNFGHAQVVLYDDRPDSPTYKLVQELNFSELNRAIFCIPKGVYHAVRNVGTTDLVCINMPTREYDYADPDKIRLPLENDVIPYVWR